LIELESIARGMVIADIVLKRAEVQIALSEPTTPGKYLLLFSGGVAEVEEAFTAGLESAGAAVVCQMRLTLAARQLVAGLRGEFREPARGMDTIGIVETHTVASSLRSADAALKEADVVLTHLHLARGIGGKGYYTLAGEQHMVEAALQEAAAVIDPGLLVATEIIVSPHRDLRAFTRQ
jgi:microcompartment protein CcmL/EutN